MKKVLLLVLCSLLIVGCSNSKITSEKKLYDEFIKEANDNTFDTLRPVDINVYLDKIIDSEVTYRIIIDNPKEALESIQAIAIHNLKTDDIYPTSGIFDDKLSLIPNVIDKENNKVKGIILVGYIPYNDSLDNFKCTIRVLMKYKGQDGNQYKVFYKYQK
jgi:hypothetical protein